ncbi:MAG: hypothetical protein HYV29_08025 [Ignavibacteriales bacterium]|nr:hypothetical protein [Ignavibacteriales bacterium]
MKKSFFFLTLSAVLCSCTITTHYIQDGASAKTAVAAESVKIYTGDIAHDYDVIGSVAVDVAGDGKKAALKLKEKAGSIGANAVIMTKLTKLASYGGRTGLSGVAVYVK